MLRETIDRNPSAAHLDHIVPEFLSSDRGWSWAASGGPGESMSGQISPDQVEGYEEFLGQLKGRIRTARLRAALAANRELIEVYAESFLRENLRLIMVVMYAWPGWPLPSLSIRWGLHVDHHGGSRHDFPRGPIIPRPAWSGRRVGEDG
jgi:hypothetical protein